MPVVTIKTTNDALADAINNLANVIGDIEGKDETTKKYVPLTETEMRCNVHELIKRFGNKQYADMVFHELYHAMKAIGLLRKIRKSMGSYLHYRDTVDEILASFDAGPEE